MDRLFVDTSAWYAFCNAKDPRHEAVSIVLSEWEGRLVSTEYVFDELVTLVRYRVGHAPAAGIGAVLREGSCCLLLTVEPQDVTAAWGQFTLESDQRYSFTDCTSFVLMRRLGIEEVLTLDQHFAQEGFVVLP